MAPGIRRRRSAPGAVKFEEGDAAAPSQSQDRQLLRLAVRMRIAELALHAAMDGLARAEQRVSAQRGPRTRRPAWYVAAEVKEAEAGATLELIYRRIVQSPARTRAGLAIKLQLAAMLYGENLEGVSDDTDLISQLLRSLIADIIRN